MTTTVVNQRALTPLAVYRQWWETVEACSRRDGDFERIRWFLVDNLTTNDDLVVGRWLPPHDILIRADRVDDGFVVRHEVLHDLLRGDSDHSQAEWDACALDPGSR